MASIILASVVVSLGSPASAHVTTATGYATAEAQGSDIDLTLSLDYDLLARAVGLGPKALDAGHDVARARALESSADPISAYVAERVVLSLGAAACEPTLRDTAVERRQGAPYALLRLGMPALGPRTAPTGSSTTSSRRPTPSWTTTRRCSTTGSAATRVVRSSTARTRR